MFLENKKKKKEKLIRFFIVNVIITILFLSIFSQMNILFILVNLYY